MTTICFIDGDSIAYAGGHCEYHEQMEMTVNNYIADIRRATGADKLVGFVENPDRSFPCCCDHSYLEPAFIERSRKAYQGRNISAGSPSTPGTDQ